jgi:hypothetical protein
VAQSAQILSSQWRLIRVPKERVQAERIRLLAQWEVAATNALERFRNTTGSIDFENGSWDINLNANNAAVLQGLAALLEAHPWLTLHITGKQIMPSAYARLDCEDKQARPHLRAPAELELSSVLRHAPDANCAQWWQLTECGAVSHASQTGRTFAEDFPGTPCPKSSAFHATARVLAVQAALRKVHGTSNRLCVHVFDSSDEQRYEKEVLFTSGPLEGARPVETWGSSHQEVRALQL